MRIKVVQKPQQSSIDGIQLDNFLPGQQYEVGNTIGALFLAEGWAVPVADDEPAILIPRREFAVKPTTTPSNLIRDKYPSYYDEPLDIAAERPHKPRTRS
jgi:hypothetical protein